MRHPLFLICCLGEECKILLSLGNFILFIKELLTACRLQHILRRLVIVGLRTADAQVFREGTTDLAVLGDDIGCLWSTQYLVLNKDLPFLSQVLLDTCLLDLGGVAGSTGLELCEVLGLNGK